MNAARGGVWLVLWGATAAAGAEPNAELLTAQVRTILEAKCAGCHGEHLAKPEGRFGHVRDLRRLVTEGKLVVRGDLRNSELYRLVREREMPPADSEVPPLTPAEKHAVRQWIFAGAPHQLPEDWQELAARHPPQAPPPAAAPPDAVRPPESASEPLSLELLDRPAGEIFREITAQTGTEIRYTPPAVEPRLSIRLRDGTVREALEYLALCGNLVLRWQGEAAVLGPAPPLAGDAPRAPAPAK